MLQLTNFKAATLLSNDTKPLSYLLQLHLNNLLLTEIYTHTHIMHTHTHTYSSNYLFFRHKLQQIAAFLVALSVEVCRTLFFLLHPKSKLQQI